MAARDQNGESYQRLGGYLYNESMKQLDLHLAHKRIVEKFLRIRILCLGNARSQVGRQQRRRLENHQNGNEPALHLCPTVEAFGILP